MFKQIQLNNGDSYEGNFINNNWSGCGTYFYADGRYCGRYYDSGRLVYEGQIKNGNFDGFGKYYFKNGDISWGFFVNSKFHGTQLRYFADLDKYDFLGYVNGQKGYFYDYKIKELNKWYGYEPYKYLNEKDVNLFIKGIEDGMLEYSKKSNQDTAKSVD